MKIGIKVDGVIVFIEVAGLNEEKLLREARKELADMTTYAD